MLGRLGRKSVILLLLVTSTPALAAEPFASFYGSWKGFGRIVMTDGSREKIRCRADYVETSGGNGLNLRVDCASDSYKVDLVSNVIAATPSRVRGRRKLVRHRAM